MGLLPVQRLQRIQVHTIINIHMFLQSTGEELKLYTMSNHQQGVVTQPPNTIMEKEYAHSQVQVLVNGDMDLV